MATWHGKPHTYMLEVHGDYGYPDYGKVEYKWEYATCADILTIYRTEEGKKPSQELFGKYEAIAQMETLIDWFATYESLEDLEAIIGAIKKARE